MAIASTCSKRLKGCQDPEKARDLLAEADVVLGTSDLRPTAWQAFWHSLATDLEVVVEESTKLLAKDAAARLATVIAVVQADIAQYLLILSSSGTPSYGPFGALRARLLRRAGAQPRAIILDTVREFDYEIESIDHGHLDPSRIFSSPLVSCPINTSYNNVG